MTSSQPGPPARGDSVRRLIFRLVAINLLVVVLMLVLGLLAAWRSTESVRYVAERLQPLSTANAELGQDQAAAEGHLRTWSLDGDPAQVRKYRRALQATVADRAQLGRQQTDDPRLAELVSAQDEALRRWREQYADRRLAGRPGLAHVDAALLQRGLLLSREVNAANRAVGQRIDLLSDRARADADQRLELTLGVLGFVAIAGLVTVLLVARRVGRRLVEPLVGLEGAVVRLTGGDRTARSAVSGPSEVRRVAAALNLLADENERARAVEQAIIEQLRALDSIKSDFVSNVSHELRTPLTSISGYVEILGEQLGDRLTEDEAEMLGAAKRNVGRLSDLIEDLLTLSRAETRGTDLQRVDLVPLVTAAVNDLRVAAGNRGVQIVVDRPDDPVLVLADASQVSRAVVNLLSNAVKYSHGAPRVEVRLTVVDTDALLEVCDHGIGIPDREMGDLGSRFYRASNAVHLGISGTGLGLRIVQAIVDNHEGSLEIQSEQDVGTTVRMRLPLQAHMAPVGRGPAGESRAGNITPD